MSRKRRTKTGERALKEIDLYQKMDRPMVPRANMERVMREILASIPSSPENPKKRRISPLAIDAIQVLAEDYIVKRFKASQILAIHAHRVTVQPEDWHNAPRIVAALTGEEDVNEKRPINARFSAKKAGKACITKKSDEQTSELSDAYLKELSHMEQDLRIENDDETDSQDLCYQLENEESDSSEYEMNDSESM